MNFIPKLKLEKLGHFCQIMILDENGFISSSCDSLFSTKELKKTAVQNWFPLLESIIESVSILEENQPLLIRKIPKPASFLSGIYDLEFSVRKSLGKTEFLLTILDFSNIYEELLKFQQERNECVIKMEHMQTELIKYKSSPK